jgi:hypothetical protein
MTYKKAIRLITQILRLRGLELSKGAQKQAGYLTLFATEGEESKGIHHDIKFSLNKRVRKCIPGSMDDNIFLERMEKYADLLQKENEEGGDIDLAWLIKESKEEEIWKVFAGEEV